MGKVFKGFSLNLTMDFKAITDIIGIILMLFSFTFMIPIITGLMFNENIFWLVRAFGLPAVITFCIGTILWALGERRGDQVRDREAFAAVGLGWLMVAILGAQPYILTGTFDSFDDAFFESMSGFTTTGATVLNVEEGKDFLDVYPHSIMLWRSMSQWLGGMGIIVLSVVILARVIGGGLQLLSAEVPGPTVTRLRPKIQHTATILWSVYTIFTLVEIFLLYIAGMNLFDATTHSFTTLATGGFSTYKDGIVHFNSVWIEAIITIFMIIAGTNFVLHYHALTGKPRRLFDDPEFRFYITILIVGTLLICTNLLVNGKFSLQDSLRFGAFQTISITTTTGFNSEDFGSWPDSSMLILFFLMFVGGCAGSTGSSIKIIRFLILMKVARREVQKVLHPRAVMPIKLGRFTISEDIVARVSIFFIIYFLIFFFGSITMTFIAQEMDMVSAMSSVAACLGNVGPGLGIVGPTYNYAFIPPVGKILLSVFMWLGRLEIFAALILFFPSTYKA